MYNVYKVDPRDGYCGFALVAAENATQANELIADFKEQHWDNPDSFGWSYVEEDKDRILFIHSLDIGIRYIGIYKI